MASVRHPSFQWSRQYSAALKERLASKAGGKSRSAASLGRDALAIGLGAAAVAKIHERVLRRLLPQPSSNDGLLGRTTGFLVEALRPIEKAHRSALRSNGQGARLEKGERAAALVAIRRQLQHEARRCAVAEGALEAKTRHYRELLEKSRLMQEHLRRLSHEILSAHEEERRKISRELHDEVGQILAAVNVKLATLKTEAAVNTKDLKRKIGSTQRLVERSMSTVHRFARELRPPLLDDLGLVPALHAYMKGFTKRTNIPIHFRTFAAIERLDLEKRTVLYRVAQEALTNVAKHAEASLVEVTLQRRGGLVVMEIHDHGKSFQTKRVFLARQVKRLGLLGMRERVEMVDGDFAVESSKGKGTTIRVRIPYRKGRRRLATAGTES